MLRKTIILSLFLFVSTILVSQVEDYDFEYPYKNFSSNITYDQDGFLWYPDYEETDYFRYNGNDSHALGLPEILAAYPDKYIIENALFFDGRLMLNSREKLSFLDLRTKQIEEVWEVPPNHIIDIVHQDDDKGLWLFTTDKGKDSRPVYYAPNGTDLTYAFDLHPHFGDKSINWWYELSDANGLLYFYGMDGDFLILNKKGEVHKLKFADQEDFDQKLECSVFRLDNRNNLWRSHRKDVETYDSVKGVFIKHPLSGTVETKSKCPENYKRGLRIKKIWEDRRGRNWFAGEASFLMLYDRSTGESTFFDQRLINDIGGKGGAVNNLIEDNEGNMYGTKRGGVFKISKKRSNVESFLVDTKDVDHPIYKTKEYLNLEAETTSNWSQIINTAAFFAGEDSSGDLFFRNTAHIYKLDMGKKEIRIVPFQHELFNVEMFVHDDIKILSKWSHVYRIDESNNFTKLAINPSRLKKVLFQSNGKIWYAGAEREDTIHRGYYRFLAKADESLNYTETFRDPEGKIDFEKLLIYAMVEDDQSNIWLGTRNGLVVISEDEKKVEQKKHSYLWDKEEISLVNHGVLEIQWLGNDLLGFKNDVYVGVLNTKTNNLLQLVSKEALNSQVIRSVYFATPTTAWIGERNRISYHDFESNETIYFAHELSLQKAGSINSIDPIRNSKLVVSTENGAYLFNPTTLLSTHAEVAEKNRSTEIQLTNYSFVGGNTDSIEVRNYFATESHGLTFDHNDKMLNLEFALMNFTKQDDHTFSYMLEGYESQWTTPVKDNVLHYTNLPSGNYNLKVRAHNGNGIWTQSILNMPILIKTAWYKSWWFLVLCLLMAALMSYLLVKRYLYLAKTKLENVAQAKEAERLRELDNLKNLFFTNITHEFRTPLTVINGVNESSTASTKEKVMIRRNSNNLLHLINQILDLSKLESRKLTLQLAQSDIVPFLKYLTSSFASLADDRGVQLDFNSNIGEVVMNYDEIRVQQIIYNLLSNALKSTEKGGRVSLKLTKEGADNKKLKITVSDTGHGIAQADIPFLFDHFYQVSNSSSNPGEGSGVGLSLTKELVEMMDGEISLTSELQVGTHFTVVLPISKEMLPELIPSAWDDEQVSPRPVLSETIRLREVHETEASYPTNSNKPILLIIEDNLDIISYISNLLHRHYQIVVSVNGELGIQKAKEILPDIIISDVMMPIKTGFEVCDTLKQDPTTDHIPIILLTARATFEDRIQGLKYGADAYINKPFAKEELLTRLEQLIMVRTKIQERYAKQVILPIPEEPTQEDAFYLKLQKVVMDNLSDVGFGVPELAHAMLMSQTQIFRKTKAVVNKTPAIFIRSIRLEKAKEMLRNSNLTITEIAKKTGFRDPSYFARTFSKEYGTSPSDFRK